MKKSSSGVIAGVVAALACAAPALAGPTVTVRVEGQDATLLERTQVTLSGRTLDFCGVNENADTAAHALDEAIGPNWSRSDFVQVVLGESHTFANNDYWGQWIGRGGGYRFGGGICNDILSDGDEALLLVDVAGAAFEPTRFPLDVEGVPATAQAGQAVTVTVVAYGTAGTPGTGTRVPVEGASVGGGGETATTAADGTATLRFPTPGDVIVKATKAGAVISAGRRIAVSADPAPGGPVPAPVPLGPATPDRTAPVPAFAVGLPDGKVFSRGTAPRELAGTVQPDASGLTSVRLSIARTLGSRCWTFRGETERFKRHRCGGSWYFRIGDRADWSYLLPRALPKGRYTIGVLATDRAFNAARSEVEIRVK